MGRRLLLYSHDSYGLGHFRRNLTLAEHLLACDPQLHVLSVTGSPRAHSFRLPHRLDTVKLPCVTKDASGAYVARELDLDLPSIVRLRSALLEECVRGYQPDVVLVDHVPGGLAGEMLPALRELERRNARLVLGLRDVLDDPARVRAEWARSGAVELMADTYDAILVYGDREVYDPVLAYGLPPAVAQKVTHVGYVARRPDVARRDAVRASLGLEGRRLVVVTAGGGGDGQALLGAWLRALEGSSEVAGITSLLVTGPLMSGRKRERLQELASRAGDARLVEFLPDLPEVIAAADLVISMGGYNTVTEILAARTPALIWPRTAPRLEQWVRAQALERRGLVTCVDPETATPRSLLRDAMKAMSRGPGDAALLPSLDGPEGARKVLFAARSSDAALKTAPRLRAGGAL